jgi:hypothetical protein
MSIQLYKCIIYARTKLLSRNSLQLQQKEQQRQLVQLYEIYKRINELSSPTAVITSR